VIGAPELAEDPRFKDGRSRGQHRPELREECEKRLRLLTSEDLVTRLNAAGVPAGPILTLDQTFADPQVKHLAMTGTVSSPKYGDLNVVRAPVNLTRTPASLRSAAPLAGQHTDEILAEHGYSEAEIAALRLCRAVGQRNAAG